MSFKSNEVAEPAFFTVEQVAQIATLSVATIRRAIRKGKLKAHHFGDAVRISREDLNAYLDGSRG
jgi:excisionase family DNA binding protein